MKIDKKLLSEIECYCKYNNISNIDDEVNRLLRIGFNVDKYGLSPFIHLNNNDEIGVDTAQSSNNTNSDSELKKEKIETKKDVPSDSKEDTIVKEKPKKRVRIIKSK